MNLLNCRLRVRMTQAQVAEQMAVDRSTVAKWESGENSPTADKLPQLARLYHCTIDDLYSEDLYDENDGHREVLRG